MVIWSSFQPAASAFRITERTRATYAAWVDMDELHREDDEVAGMDVAMAAMEELKEINRNRRSIGRALR